MHEEQPKANYQKLILGKKKALADSLKDKLSFLGSLMLQHIQSNSLFPSSLAATQITLPFPF